MLGQRKLLARLGPGLVHAFIFWGFCVLLPTIVIAMIAIVDRQADAAVARPPGLVRAARRHLRVLVLCGVLAALYIRKVQRPRRFEGSHLREADLILAWIAWIVTTLLLWHASRIALHLNEFPAGWAPVSHALSHLFGRGGAAATPSACSSGRTCWDPLVPRLPPLLQAPAHRDRGGQRLVRAHRARGRLEPLRFDEDADEDELRFGAGTIADLTWKEMLDGSRAPSAGAARTPARRSRPARRCRRSS